MVFLHYYSLVPEKKKKKKLPTSEKKKKCLYYYFNIEVFGSTQMLSLDRGKVYHTKGMRALALGKTSNYCSGSWQNLKKSVAI